ncbi:PQQ-binding-like beta-propeller repeat protein [Rhodopirellula sallentina]|uniref:Pyrrolo-quinoline quinone n=1 Tax=Rhodopirellula sallentina SM41 TaxID=1263870 RepID=M5UQ13_9BACT|nr:PQQ-binding-like beta-propeller repeat protein [Rhodopirellula sallentina]EMI58083.1 Pyrrolo-quinoline quinone [Rhodopirellula sallentina SM41]
MQPSSIDRTISVVVFVMAVFCLVSLFFARSSIPVGMRVPGMDGTPQVLVTANRLPYEAVIAGRPVSGSGVASAIGGTWPGFRGPNHDGVSRENKTLARHWPETGPQKCWEVTLCEGYASPAVRDGRVYVLDYDEAVGADVLRCLSLDDGREIWRAGYPVAVTRNHGITRTVPVLFEDCVITFGPQCHVACWDAVTGENRWLMDLRQRYQTTVPRWYAGQCPLIDQGRLILAPGDAALMVAIDPKSGAVIWQTENPRGWEMTHGSIAVMHHAGVRMYVYCGSGGVIGVDAETGELLWETMQWPVQFAHTPTPVPLPDGRIFVCSGYGNDVGALMLRLDETARNVSIERKFSPKEFNSEQQTPIFYNDHLFGIRKRGGGPMVCMDVDGNEIWNSGRDRFGHGPYLIADGLLFMMSNFGELTIAEASHEGYRRLASHLVFEDGHDAWGPMAIVNGYLLLRDMTRLVCLDVAARETSVGEGPL